MEKSERHCGNCGNSGRGTKGGTIKGYCGEVNPTCSLENHLMWWQEQVKKKDAKHPDKETK